MFDVVVVGGGSAGCVVAARLAESGSRSVLLLEAGPDLRAATPDVLRDGWQVSRDFDWGYASEPDTRGEVQQLWRQKLLGGTSWTTRFALRGAPADYDGWEARGATGWGFEQVLPFFARLEADADFGDEPFHGDSGPMPVRRYLEHELTEVAEAGMSALRSAGFPAVADHNRPGAIGAGRMPMTSREGARVTTADAYLPAGATPPNLTIRPGAHVADILVDGDRAAGVRLVGGEVVEAGWVVLCAGVYGSPAVLMRSGIGPADELRAAGVRPRVDLPGVGANLVDHPAVTLDCGYRGTVRTSPYLHIAATFHSTGTPTDAAPDLMLWLADPAGDPPSFEIDVVLLRPRSTGRVALRSADPAQPPRIELPALGALSDVARLAEGFLRALEVAARPELRRLCAGPPSPLAAGEEELRALIRAERYSLPHVVGTCAMGSVVDPDGRVRGMEALSVIDASIIPEAPSGFTHLPTIMLAERLAERTSALL